VPFDPKTAQPLENVFDPSTAKPFEPEEPQFEPYSPIISPESIQPIDARPDATDVEQILRRKDEVDSVGDVWTRGFKNAGVALGNAVNIIPTIIQNTDQSGMFKNMPEEIKKNITTDEQREKYLKEKADDIVNYFSEIEAKPATGRFARPPESIFGYLDPKRLFMVAGENAPLMGGMIATTIANPFAGALLMGAIEGGQTKSEILQYEERTGKRVPEHLRRSIPLIVGSINASLERTGIDRILKGFPGLKSRIASVLLTSATEGTTEAFQGLNQQIAEQLTQEEKELFKDFDWSQLGQEFYAGVVLGAGSSSISEVAGIPQSKADEKFKVSKIGIEIERARDTGDFEDITLNMAERFAKQNPEAFENNSALQFISEVRTITRETLKAKGENPDKFFVGEGLEADTKEAQVLGSTLEENGQVLINLYKGARPDTVIEEFYGNAYRNLSSEEKSIWEEYYAEKVREGETLTKQELFEKEGTQYYFDESLYENSTIAKVLQRVKQFLNNIIGRSKIDPKIRKMWEDAGYGKVGKGATSKDESFQLKKELKVERSERKTINPKNVKFSTLEKKKINTAVEGTDFNKKEVLSKVQLYKSKHPVNDGWAKLEVNKVDTSGKNPKVEYKPIPYTFQQYKGKTPNKKSPVYKRMVTSLGKKAVNDFIEVAERAKAGDKNAQAIIEQATWYSELKAKIHQQFGGQTQIFGELLGATSPQTPVSDNFKNALEALETFNKGGYDDIVQQYVQYIEDGGVPSKYKGPVPEKSNGAKYGTNSPAVLDVLASRWILTEPGSSPKAKNFALNILGKSDHATIDVWSARAWQRRSGGKRIPVQAEQGVKGKYSADGTYITGQFGVGGDAYKYAEQKLKEMGIEGFEDTQSIDLQAVDWFLEKENWTENNWTTVSGEGGSFEDNLIVEYLPKYKGGGTKPRDYDRQQVGHSIQQLEEPTKVNIEKARERLKAVASNDNNIRAIRYEDSKGLYTYLDDSGEVIPDQEKSFDTELTVEKGHVPVEFYNEVLKISKENNQVDTFFSKVLRANEVSENARPGIEVEFKNPLSESEVEGIVSFIRGRGHDGFTLSREKRNKEGLYTGIRLQIIPEITARYDMEFRESLKDPKFLDNYIKEKNAELEDVARELDKRNDVEDSYFYSYITEVVGRENIDEYIQRKSQKSGSQIWQGRSIREETQNAIQRYEKAERKQRPTTDRNKSEKEESYQITAFHGSPYKFDQFDSSQIGSGEGNQAFGHGLYFSSKEDIAKYYIPFKDTPDDAVPEKTGSLYRVTLHKGKDPSEYDYISWVDNVTESQKVKILKHYLNNADQLTKYQIDVFDDFILPDDNIKGNDLYRGLRFAFRDRQTSLKESSAKLSKFLLDAGIDGIRYPAQGGTGGRFGDSENYVVFDDSAVTIDKQESFQLDALTDMTIPQRFERRLIDKLNRLKMVQESVPDLQEDEDAIQIAETLHGTVSTQLEKFRKKIYDGKESILSRAKKDGHSLDDIGEYLYARHAKERNIAMQEKNPKLETGSGMADADANAILKKYRGTGIHKYALELYREVTNKALKVRLDAGLIDKETYQNLKSNFKNYVPLKGLLEEDGYVHTSGKGFSTTSTGIMSAFGRESKAQNPLIQAVIDYESAVYIAENNKVGNAFLKMVQNNESPIWNVTKRKFKPVYNEEGEVSYSPTNLKDDEFQTYVDGDQYVIKIRDKDLLRAMKNLNATTQNGAMRFLNKFNTYYRAINTTINPEFMITNFERDLQTALLNMTSEGKKNIKGKIVKDIKPAMSGIRSLLRKDGSHEWAKIYEEFKANGGKAGWLDFGTIEQKMADIEKDIKRAQEGNSTVQKVRDFIEQYNEIIENAVRLSTYKNLVDSGISKKQSAHYAKDLTVNFNRKGEWGTAMNTLWTFSNAGMQGSNRIWRALKSKNGKKVASSITAFGFLMSALNRYWDEDEWNQFDENNKDNYFMILLPNKKAFSIKLPYGWNWFYGVGGAVEQTIFGDTTYGELITRTAKNAVDAFAPISGGSLAQFGAPTIFDPAIQLSENKNFFGGPIMKDKKAYGKTIKDHERGFKSVSPTIDRGTKGLYDLTGLDVSPETIEHIIESYSGGAGKFVANTVTTAIETGKGSWPDMSKIPVYRQFVKGKSDWRSYNKVKEMLDVAEDKVLDGKLFRKYLNEAQRAQSIDTKMHRKLMKQFNNAQRKAKRNRR